MKVEELLTRRQELTAQVAGVLQNLEKLATDCNGEGKEISGMLALYLHESSRRAEELVHRLNDVVTVLIQRTDEGMEEIVKRAEADGTIQFPGKE